MFNHRAFWYLALGAVMIGLLLTAVVGGARTAQAVEVIPGGDGVIGADEVIDDDVIIGAATVTVEGTVNGMLIASGQTVTVNGVVNGDLVVSGQDIFINGPVAGNVFAAGANLKLSNVVSGSVFMGGAQAVLASSAEIKRNLFWGGFSLVAEAGSKIARDAQVGGYQAILAGVVDGDLNAGVGALELSGTVGGDINLEVGEPEAAPTFLKFTPTFQDVEMVDGGLRVLPGAVIGGSLHYTSPVEQAGGIRSQPAGQVKFTKQIDGRKAVEAETNLDWLFNPIRELVTLTALGALAVWLLPRPLDLAAEQVERRTLGAFGRGLLVVVGGYALAAVALVLLIVVVIILAVTTLGGLSQAVGGLGFSGLGLAFAVFSFLVAYGSKLVVAQMAGNWLTKRAGMTALSGHRLWPLLVGIVVYVILHAVFVLGAIINVVVILIGVGAMWLAYRESRASGAALAALEAASSQGA